MTDVWALTGYSEPSCQVDSTQWERKGGCWNQLRRNDGKVLAEFENIMQWDDSGAQEAYLNAMERYQASARGLIHPMSLPDPDLYIQTVDWDTHDGFDLPESADMFSARREGKRQRRRVPKCEQFQCGKKGIGKSGRSYHCVAGAWRQASHGPVSYHDSCQAGLDQPMPDAYGLSNAAPRVSGCEEENRSKLQSLWQNWPSSCFGWQSSLGAQIGHEYRPNRSEQAPVTYGGVCENGAIQTPIGVQAAFGASRTNGVCSSVWMGHCQLDGEEKQQYPTGRQCLRENDLGQGHVSLADGTQRWQSNLQYHYDRY